MMETVPKEEGHGDHVATSETIHDSNQSKGQRSETCSDNTDSHVHQGAGGDASEMMSTMCKNGRSGDSHINNDASIKDCGAVDSTSNQEQVVLPDPEKRTSDRESEVCVDNKNDIPDVNSTVSNMIPDELSTRIQSKVHIVEDEDADFVDAQDTLEEEDAEGWQDASDKIIPESSEDMIRELNEKVQSLEQKTRTATWDDGSKQHQSGENAQVKGDRTSSSDSGDGQNEADYFVAKAMEEEEEKKIDEEKSIEVDEAARLELEAAMTEEEKQVKRDEAQEHKKSGNELFKTGEFLDAVHAYTQALEICPLVFKKDRSVMFANRAACHVRQEHHDDAIEDCTKALDLNPVYLKVYLRRAQVYQLTEKLDECLADYQKALELDPGNYEARAECLRLPDEIKERNEKLKEEMMGKLKDLGNLVLRPFGLSTENFQLQQDPNSGGYSINFNQNPTNGN